MTGTNQMPDKSALSGIRVLDLSRILAGPWATQLLADFGAQVIKVERPGSGDDTRSWGPPYLGNQPGSKTAAYFHSANRGKHSVAIDFTQPEGQELIKELAAISDVVVENYKVGGLKKYGLDYASLCAANPRLIYCSITGFGQTGPYKNRAGYDFMIQAMGGLMSVTGDSTGEPMKAGVALADILTGLYAANAIQAALLSRNHTGEGQHIDLALLDVQVASLANQAMNYLATEQVPERLGNAHPNIVPYQSFAASDGHFILAVGNNRQFQAFATVAGKPELAADPQFSTNQNRVQNREQLIAILKPLIARQSAQWWLEKLEEVSVPCGPINTLDKVFSNEQVLHRQTRIDFDDQDGPIPSVANPVKFSKTPVTYNKAPPILGEDTGTVLTELLQKSTTTIEELKRQGVLG